MDDNPCQLIWPTKASGPIRHTEAEWGQHKLLLQQLYFTEKKTAKEVQAHMRKTFHFDASLQQYQRQFQKWGEKKNKPQVRWTRLPGLLKRKRLDSDHAEVWDRGVVQDRKRVKKYLSRNNPPTLGQKHRTGVGPTEESAIEPCTGDDFFVRVALTPRLALSTPTNLPWFDFIRSFHLGPLSGSLTRLLPVSPVSQGRIIDEGPLENVSATQGNVWGGSLLNTQQHTASLSIHGSESLRHLTTSLVDLVCPNSHLKHRSDFEMQFNLQLEGMMPAEIPEDLDIDPTSLIQTPTVHSIAVGVAYLFYAISNNLWDEERVQSALASVLGIPGVVQFISTSSKPSAKALTQYLVKYAVDTEDLKLLKCLRTHGINFDNPIPARDAATPVQYVIHEYGLHMDLSRTEKILEFLLGSGADPNECLQHGNMQAGQNACCQNFPVMHAISHYCSGSIVDMLLAAGSYIPYDVDITLAVASGIGTSTLKRLLSEASPEPDRPFVWKEYLYPLQAAVAKSNEEIVEVLLQRGAAPSGWTDAEIESCLPDLDFPIRGGYLEEAYVKMSHLLTPLSSALLGRAKRITQTLLNAGANVNHCHTDALRPVLDAELVMDEYYIDDKNALTHGLVLTALQAAVYAEDLTEVEAILRLWVPVRSCHGTPPLVLAALSGNLALIELLVRYGVDVSETEDDRVLHISERRRFSALGAAAATGNIQMMSMLIRAGAEINQRACGPGVLSPLQAAVYFRQHQSILFLCQCGADASLPGAAEDGLTAIEAAMYAEDYWSFEFLCCQCRPNSSSVALAIGLHDGRFFQKLVEMGYNINDPEFVAESIAAGHYHRLTSAGVRLDVLFQGKTFADLAFTAAAKHNNVSVMCSILDNGHILLQDTLIAIKPHLGHSSLKLFIHVIVTAITSNNASPKFPAIALILKGFWQSVPRIPEQLHDVVYGAIEFLIAQGVDVNACYSGQLSDGLDTPIQAAVICGLIDVSRLLIENGAEVNKRPDKGMATALQRACSAGELQMISLLLAHGADVNAAPPELPNYQSKTALQLACSRSNVDIVILLIKHGANVDAAASHCAGRTALQAACEKGHVEIVNLLINHRADVNAPAAPKYGVTALQAAAIKGFLRIVQILVAAGVDVAAPASPVEGRTAIDGAAENGRLDIVQYLLDQYEGEESISAICDRARKFAWKQGHMGVVQLLDEYQRHPG